MPPIEHWIEPYLENIYAISRDPELCEFYEDFSGAWCTTASDAIADYLESEGVEASVYGASEEYEFGGVKIDDSHTWIVLDDGTILDATIRQFIDSPHAGAGQRKTASGYPYVKGFEDIAIIPPDHPFAQKMKYESHTKGRGWVSKPKWWKKTGHRFEGGPIE